MLMENTKFGFLLPALQIQAVLEQTTISKRRKALHTMPTELDSVFEDTIRRIRNQKAKQATQAMDVLKWTFLSERQLSVTELRHALAVTVTPEEPFSPRKHWIGIIFHRRSLYSIGVLAWLSLTKKPRLYD
jgi:hypothetical protein